MNEFHRYVVEFKGCQKALRTGDRGKSIHENAKNARGNQRVQAKTQKGTRLRAKATRENRRGAKDARGKPKGALEILTHINSFTDAVTGSTSFVIFSYDKCKL